MPSSSMLKVNSRQQYLIEMLQLVIDICKIRNGTRFHSQRFAVTMATRM
jgi:hypothetical protein